MDTDIYVQEYRQRQRWLNRHHRQTDSQSVERTNRETHKGGRLFEEVKLITKTQHNNKQRQNNHISN